MIKCMKKVKVKKTRISRQWALEHKDGTYTTHGRWKRSDAKRHAQEEYRSPVVAVVKVFITGKYRRAF